MYYESWSIKIKTSSPPRIRGNSRVSGEARRGSISRRVQLRPLGAECSNDEVGEKSLRGEGNGHEVSQSVSANAKGVHIPRLILPCVGAEPRPSMGREEKVTRHERVNGLDCAASRQVESQPDDV